MSEDNLDKHLRDIFEKDNYEYKPEYWQSMSYTLDTSSSISAKRFLKNHKYAILLLLLFTGINGYFALKNSKPNIKKIEVVKTINTKDTIYIYSKSNNTLSTSTPYFVSKIKNTSETKIENQNLYANNPDKSIVLENKLVLNQKSNIEDFEFNQKNFTDNSNFSRRNYAELISLNTKKTEKDLCENDKPSIEEKDQDIKAGDISATKLENNSEKKEHKKYALGIKSGIGIEFLSREKKGDKKITSPQYRGENLAFFIDYLQKEKYFISSELSFQRNTKKVSVYKEELALKIENNNNKSTQIFTNNTNSNYFSIGLANNIFIKLANHLYLGTGLSTDFNIRENLITHSKKNTLYTTEYNTLPLSETQVLKSKTDLIKPVNFAALISGRYTFNRFFVELRSKIGLNDFSKSSKEENSSNIQTTPSSIYFEESKTINNETSNYNILKEVQFNIGIKF